MRLFLFIFILGFGVDFAFLHPTYPLYFYDLCRDPWFCQAEYERCKIQVEGVRWNECRCLARLDYCWHQCQNKTNTDFW